MMIRILDSVAESLDNILSELRENPSVSADTIKDLRKAVAQITAVHNELCRAEEL